MFDSAKEYLRLRQNQDGSYSSSRDSVHSLFPSGLSSESMTAYVLHSQAMANVLDISAMKFLIEAERNGRLEDPAALALLVDSIGLFHYQLPQQITENANKLVLKLLSMQHKASKGK